MLLHLNITMKKIILKDFHLQNVISVDDITAVVKGIPSAHIAGVKTIAYDPTRYHQKSYYDPKPINYFVQGEYKIGPFEHILVYKFDNLQEFRHILFHEVGHHVFMKTLSSKDKKKWVFDVYPNSQHITEYSKSNAAEDFAESYAFFLHSPNKLKKIFKKYIFIKNNLNDTLKR